MNILYATDLHNRSNSGITFALNELAAQTVARASPGESVSLLSIGDTDVILQQEVHHIKVPPAAGAARLWRYAPSYSGTCESTIKGQRITVVHIHGVWMYPQFAAARAAQRNAIPTVLTNHGGIQWALRQPDRLGAAKKRLYLRLMKNRLLRNITVQHAITRHERDALFSFFPHPRIEVIPNFIDVQKVDHALGYGDAQRGERYMLCFGRRHPTKGIDVLIDAFAKAAIPRDWRLIIAGPAVDGSYEHRLQRLIAASPCADRIEMRDPVWDPTVKYRLMRDAWVTVVPSHTEAISLVNLESSACSTPTITTRATGLTNWTEGGGLLTDPAPEPLARALSEAAHWSDDERKQRGLASRRLIETAYSAAAIMPRWFELYRSLS